MDGYLLPNPLCYASDVEDWGAAVGLQYSDLNANNVLEKFSRDDARELEGYYMIDFALFKGNMPLLEGNVAAILDGVNVPKYQRVDRSFI